MAELLNCFTVNVVIVFGLLGCFGNNDSFGNSFNILLLVSNSPSYNNMKIIQDVQKTLKNINDDESFLNEYQLELGDIIVVSEETNSVIEDLYNIALFDHNSTNHAIINGDHSAVVDYILSSFSKLLNIPVITLSALRSSHHAKNTNGAGSVYFSLSVHAIVSALHHLINEAGWKHLGIVSEIQDTFITVQQEFFNNRGTINLTFAYIGQNSSNYFDNTDNTIFFINTFEDKARLILCEAFKQQMYYPRYVWILYGWYSDGWFTNTDGINCTMKEMSIVLRRAIVIQQYTSKSTQNMVLPSNLHEKENLSSLLARDAVLTLAIALNDSIASNPLFPEQCISTTTSTQMIDCRLNSKLADVTFEGYSGFVSFDENGNRIVSGAQYLQFRNYKKSLRLIHFAICNFENQTFLYTANESVSTTWPEGVPHDGSPIIVVSVKELSAVIALYILATMGIIFSIVCLFFNIIFRKRKIIQLTSPNLNYFILSGAIILYASVYFRMARTNNSTFWDINCHVIIWTLVLGYSLCFTPYLAKVVRIYYIFINPTAKKKRITDKYLILPTVLQLCIVIIMLTVGTGIPVTRPSFFLENDREHPEIEKEGEKKIRYLGVNCFLPASFIWIGVMLLYFIIQHAFGIYFAIKIRNVTITVLNESKELLATLSIATIAMAEGLALSVILQDYETIVESLVCIAIIVVSTVYTGFTFIPKMESLYKDPEGKKIFNNTFSRDHSMPTDSVLSRPTTMTQI